MIAPFSNNSLEFGIWDLEFPAILAGDAHHPIRH